MTPAHDWRARRLAPEVWLLFERDLDTTPRIKAYLRRTASHRLAARVGPTRASTVAIQQQYQELKDELGLHHFKGRSFPGWHRHVVLTALTYTWLQHPRRRRWRGPAHTADDPRRDDRDPDRALLRHASALLRNHAETRRDSAARFSRVVQVTSRTQRRRPAIALLDSELPGRLAPTL